ncbi:helix-turn-helix domain-containing protein [Flavivirga abyssicola]|uniref:helix-turn-helix domain-containing protein n=1 Tax=Flavivirga abyssicola TaxID=3063533 RepID=UPI0026DF5919|nr:helix-turn-helix transcriptional regulator [Flavivirga sp. MEBiC07777]WVK12477.1 helix-turn-helix domain-containing protein [Flavivirga sp. MEBiC07777]
MKKQDIENIQFEKVQREQLKFDISTVDEMYKRFSNSHVDLFQPHRIQFHGLAIYTNGKGKHTVDFKEQVITSGTIIPCLKGQVHKFERTLKVNGFIISFDEAFITEGLNDKNLFHFLQLYHTPHLNIGEENIALLFPFINQLKDLIRSPNLNLKKELIQSVFISLILQIKRNSIYQHKVFQSQRYRDYVLFQDLLDTHFQQTHNAADYAEMMRVSYKYLNDICKDLAHKTAKSFIDSWLITEIKRKLTEKLYSSQEIAYDLGFSDPSNFVRFFKKYEKMTPTQFVDKLLN